MDQLSVNSKKKIRMIERNDAVVQELRQQLHSIETVQ